MPRFALRPLALAGILALVAVVIGAQAPSPTDIDKATAQIVVKLVEQIHMAKPQIDDDIAEKWGRNFIKDLDPQKYYFLKADVDEFLAQATTLDDKVKEGNLDFPKLVFARFLKRCDERLETVKEMAQKRGL